MPNKKNVRPPIGPEIGPDPRNSSASIAIPGRPAFLGTNGIRFDFNHGYRVELPPGNREFRVKVYDLDAQILMAEHRANAGVCVTGARKYFIRCRLEVYDQESGNLVFEHDYDCAGRKVVIVIPDGGLGDNLAWLPYAEEFRVQHHARVTCVCGEWLIRLVRDRYPEIDFVPITRNPDMAECYACYFCAIFPENRKDWRPGDHQYWGMQRSVALLLGLEPVARQARLPEPVERTIPEPYVCISTMATNPAKYWNYPDGWNILCRYLKRLGYRVLVIDRDRDLWFAGECYRVPEEAEDFTGLRPIRERMELLQHAECFVGLPSGLSWLAWNCNIPVVMLSGFTLDGSEFPTPYRVGNLNFCHGCWNDSTLFFDMTAPVWCPRHLGTAREIECTRAITPKLVLGAVGRIPSVRARLDAPVRISVIICVFSARHLRECVESVVSAFASYGQTEILLYNDASHEEGTAALLNELAAEFPDLVKVWRGAVNIGVARGRALLAEKARGDYLVSFDHDDVMLPFDVARVVGYMDAHPECSASYAPKYLFDDANGYRNEIHGSAFSHFTAFFAPRVNINATFLRRDRVLEAGNFRRVNNDKKSGWDDIDLLVRLSMRGSLDFDPEPRCLYRIHPGQVTSSNPPWDDWITRMACEEHRMLYDRILAGDIPDAGGDDFRIVRGLMGAAVFLNQREPGITGPILEAALQKFPDDPGVWSIHFTLLLMAGKFEELLKLRAPQFPENPAGRLELLGRVFYAYRQTGQTPPPGLTEEAEQLKQRHLAPPPIVLEALRKRRKKSQLKQ